MIPDKKSLVKEKRQGNLSIKVSSATKGFMGMEMKEGMDEETMLEILRRKMENMKPDDPDLPKMVMMRRELSKQSEIKHLKKRLADLEKGEEENIGDSIGEY